MTSGDIQGFMNVISVAVAGIIALGGVIAVFEHLSDRISIRRNKVTSKVAEHEDTLEKFTQYIDNDNKRIKELEETNKLILRGFYQLLNHEIDGSHTRQLEEVRNDMMKYLTER